MKYFSLNKTLEENKKIFLDYSKQLHPDKYGGDLELFKELKKYWDNYITINENLAWIKTELKHETKVITVAKPVYIEKIIQEKYIDENILNSGVALLKQLNKTIKNLSKDH